MKKTDKETNRIGRLPVSGETLRILRTSELQDVAGGGGESAEHKKRPL
jgi:hypothetical protein